MSSTTFYHGTDNLALHMGICLTEDERAAANYATEKNDGQVYELAADLTGLVGVEVEYNYDEGEAVIPEDLVADYATFVDCDMWNRDHDTTMLLTEAAVARVEVVGVLEVEA